jgi:hypothetical protein
MRYLALLLTMPLVAGCGTKTVTRTVRLTQTQTTTVVKRIAAPPEAVFVPDQGGDLVYKPDVIGLSATSAITDVRWASYGGTVAVGHGRFPENACVPNCAEGKIDWVTVTVSLKDRILCRGRLAYRLMALDGQGFKVPFDSVAAVVHATRQAC